MLQAGIIASLYEIYLLNTYQTSTSTHFFNKRVITNLYLNPDADLFNFVSNRVQLTRIRLG